MRVILELGDSLYFIGNRVKPGFATLPSTGECVIREFAASLSFTAHRANVWSETSASYFEARYPQVRGFALFYWGVCEHRVPEAALLMASVLASRSVSPSIWLVSMLNSGSRRLPSTGKCAILDFGLRSLVVGSVFNSG